MKNLWNKRAGKCVRKRDDARRSPVAEWVLLIALLVPLLISIGLRVLLLFNRWFDPDEYAYLHLGWMVMNGYVPYRDFFEPHTPGLWYLLAPLAWLFDESSAYLFAGRLVICLVTFAIFFMVYRLSDTGASRAAPLFSVLLLNVEITFVWRTLEVRPDQIMILGWLLGAWLLIRPREAIPRRAYCASGACVGIGLLFSPKALFAIGSLGGALLLLRPVGRVRAPAWRDLLLFAVLSLTPLACLLLWMWSRDEGWPFLLVQQAFLYSVDYPEHFSGFRFFYPALVSTPVFLACAGVGLVLATQKFRHAPEEQERRRFVILAASTLGAALAHFVFIPAPYSQGLLPLITFLSILGGECGGWISKAVAGTVGGDRRRVLAIGLAVVFMAGSFHALTSIASQQQPLTRTNREYIEWLMGVQRVTARSDAILDGYSAYIFRPQASYYGWLGVDLRMAIRSGRIKYDIPERCAINGCPVVVLDRRVLEVAPWMKEYVRANYIPSTVEGIFLRRDLKDRAPRAPSPLSSPSVGGRGEAG